MTGSSYGSFLIFAVVLVLVPGPDFAVVTKNTLAAGRWRGAWSAGGVASSNVVQGAAAATGLGAVIAGAQPLFEAVKWAGVVYLAYLGVQAVRSAVRGTYPVLDESAGADATAAALGGREEGGLGKTPNPTAPGFYPAA